MECDKICRLCASPLNRDGVDLFSNEDVNYLKKIRIYLGLEILEDSKRILKLRASSSAGITKTEDDLLSDTDVPVKMCGNCSFEFENIDSFKERCIQAQKLLETLLNKCHYRILSDDEVQNPKTSGSTATNVPLEGNQFMILSNQSAGTLVSPNYVNSNSSLPRTGVNEICNFQPVQNHNIVMVNDHNPNNTLNIPLQSMPVNGIVLPQTQFVMHNSQSGLQFQNQNSTVNNHLQNVLVDVNNERQLSLNASSQSNNQPSCSVDSNGQENVMKMTINDTLLTPKMEVNIKKESDGEEEEEEDDDDDDDDDDNDNDGDDVTRPSSSAALKDYDDNNVEDDESSRGSGDNESCTVKNDHEPVPITVDLVKKVKKEKLDVCEEMASVRDSKCSATIELLQSTDELIVGMQMDDLLLKAVKNNETDKHEIVSANDCSNIKDNGEAIKSNKEMDIFNLNNIKHIKGLSFSSSVVGKMIDANVPVSNIVSMCLGRKEEIVNDKNHTSIDNFEHNRDSTLLGTSKNLDDWFEKKMKERYSAQNSNVSTSDNVCNAVTRSSSRITNPVNNQSIRTTPVNQSITSTRVNQSVRSTPVNQSIRTTPINPSVTIYKNQFNQRREVILKPGFKNQPYISINAPMIVPNVQHCSVPSVNSNFKDAESKLKYLLQPSLQKTNKPINTMESYFSPRSKNNTQLKRKIDESDNKRSDPDYKPKIRVRTDKFECPICDRRFDRHSYLINHMKLHNTQ